MWESLMLAVVGVCVAAAPRDAERLAPRSGVLVVSVGDAATGSFIPDAQVRLPSVGRVARTQWNGEARFAGLSDGRYRIQVRAIGYAPADIEMPVSGDSAGIYFALERTSIALDTVRVTDRAPVTRGLAEFEARRKMGIGRFLTDSVLRDDRTHSLQYLLATRVSGIVVTRNHGITTTEPSGQLSTDPCPVLLYLDGLKLNNPGGGSVDLDAIRTDDLAGIEVYSRVTAPVQYRPLGVYCKVILLWSKW